MVVDAGAEPRQRTTPINTFCLGGREVGVGGKSVGVRGEVSWGRGRGGEGS